MSRSFLTWVLAGLLGAVSVSAQEPPLEPRSAERPSPDQRTSGPEAVPEPEPINPREALFLAIELKDEQAARRALRQGAESEISLGNPSPLATAALHNDLRMVRLLLSFGGNPGATKDSPLEEAIRHENTLMVALFLRSGARVPSGRRGEEMFRLAQRGSQYRDLSKILLDSGGNPDHCLAAATRSSQIEAIKYCLSRGGNVAALPGDLNLLSVALRSADAGFIEQVVGQGLDDKVYAGALPEAITAGDLDLVRRAVTGGAELRFSHIEAAVASGRPEICLHLLDQSPPNEPGPLAGGDVAGLIQQTDDLGLDELSMILRRKSGRFTWTAEKVLPVAAVSLLALALIAFLTRNLRRQSVKVSVPETMAPTKSVPGASAPRSKAARGSATTPAPSSITPTDRDAAPPLSAPSADPSPGASQPSAGERSAAPASAASPPPEPALGISSSPDAFATVVSLPTTVAPPPPTPVTPAPVATGLAEDPESIPPAAVLAQTTPAPSQSIPIPAVAETWQTAPEPATLPPPPREVAAPVVALPQDVADIELRMPEVDLTRSADTVFQAARQAAAGASGQPGASGQRQVVLVTPARVTMLYPCPAPGTVVAAELAAARAVVPTQAARNVAVIGYNDLETLTGGILQAIPFFGLLRQLGYLGHAVWIFEGHVSAMMAGCQDADVLLVDDGMMRHLPGNWRSVATRVMRGSDIYAFERKAGTLRRLT